MNSDSINKIQINAWAPRSVSQIEAELPLPNQEDQIVYQVKRGDTLGKIINAAKKKHKLKTGQNVRTVANQSNIKNPHLIQPGDIIIIYVEKEGGNQPPLFAALGPIPFPLPAATNTTSDPNTHCNLPEKLQEIYKPEDLFQKNRKLIKEDFDELISTEVYKSEHRIEERPSINRRLFEYLTVKWLLEREMGNPRINTLRLILGFGFYGGRELRNISLDPTLDKKPYFLYPLGYASPDWLTKLALILINSLDHAELLKILLELLRKALPRETLIKILEMIFGKEAVEKALSDSRGNLGKAIKELCKAQAETVVNEGLTDQAKHEILNALLEYYNQTTGTNPLIKAEILTLLANYAKRKDEVKSFLEAAQKLLSKEKIERLGPIDQGYACRLLAQICLSESGKLTDSQEKLKKLDEAFSLFAKAHQLLLKEKQAFAVLAVKQQIAEVLLQKASVIADLSGASHGAHELLCQAELFTQEVLAWKEDYLKEIQTHTKGQGIIHPWLKQIAEQAGFSKAKLLRLEDKLSEAEKILRKLLESSPDNKAFLAELSRIYQRQGDMLVTQGKFTDAAEKYKKALELWDQNLEARASLADVYNWQRKYQEAEKHYQMALNLKARLGLAEIALRCENYGEIDRAIEIVKTILEKEPKDSYLIPRAKKLWLEIADAYLAQDKYHDALLYLNKILKDPLSTNRLTIQACLRVARIYNSQGEKTKAREYYKIVFLHYYNVKIEALSLEEKLMMAEAQAYFKGYKKALEIYNALLNDPTLDELQTLEILLRCANIYTYDWEGKDLAKAEESFKIIALSYWGRPAEGLKNREKLLFAEALLSMGEMKRYGKKRNEEMALLYYKNALEALKTAPQTRFAVGLKAKTYYGLAKAHEMEGDKAAAQKAIAKAKELKKYLSEERQSDAERAYAKSLDPLMMHFTQAAAQDNRGNRWVENRSEIEVPVYSSEKKEISVKIKNQTDQGKNTADNSTYVVVESQPLQGLTLKGEFKIPKTTFKLPGSSLKLFRSPDVSLSGQIDTRHLSISGTANLHHQYGSLLNTYSGGIFYKIFKNYGQLQAGLEASYYRFPFLQRYPAMLDLAPGLKYQLDLGELGILPYDFLSVHFLCQYIRKIRLAKTAGETDLNGYALGGGFDLNLTYILLRFDYLHRQDSFFREDIFSVNANLAPAVDWLIKKIFK